MGKVFVCFHAVTIQHRGRATVALIMREGGFDDDDDVYGFVMTRMAITYFQLMMMMMFITIIARD